MRMDFKIVFAVMAGVCLALTSARATTIDLTVDPNFPPGTTPYVLGNVNPPEPASDADDVNYINAMIGLTPGGSATIAVSGGSDIVYRSGNAFSGLTTATTLKDKSGTSTSIPLTSGYEYLAGKYDGPNGGLEIWDIASITAGDTIDIPQNAYGSGNDKYGLSGWWLFNQQGQSVPDGCPTWWLLAIGLFGLDLMGRYMAAQPKAAQARIRSRS
ncbi:MAG TPA: hypothetical protein VGV18_02895 [Verrucomicrobiae bacterium]|nr:hypothetical protein [Verrucomicrobiae bacterium]